MTSSRFAVNFLLDTNVISEATKRQPSPAMLEWVGAQPIDTIYTASLALGRASQQLEAAAS